MPPRVLAVNRNRLPAAGRVQSRAEALRLLMLDEYDSIELYTAKPACDDYELVAYLAGTWPSYFRRLSIRTVTNGKVSAEWNHETARFDLIAPPPRPRRRIQETTRPLHLAL